MKFFVYIADAKVDSLLAALTDRAREDLAQELAIDPAILARTEVRRGDADALRFARAEAAGRELAQTRASAPLDLDASAPFIADSQPLNWGRLRVMQGGELVRHETESPVAFAFAGGKRELIMMGSASQLLAQPPNATVAAANPDVQGEAARLIDIASDLDAVDRRGLERLLDGAQLGESSGPWASQLARARTDLRALPSQRLEYLAKRVATVEAGSRIVLATPIYFAMVV